MLYNFDSIRVSRVMPDIRDKSFMAYKFNSRKKNSKYHLIHKESGLTYCKAENGSWNIDSYAEKLPEDKTVCSMCCHLFKDKKVPTKTSKKQKTRDDTKGFYQSDEWARLRYDMLKNATHCLCCGATKKDARLTVDHVKPIWRYPELRLEPGNLQILCLLCNRGKGGRDETDFRNIERPLLMDVVFTELIDEERTGKKLN